MRLRNCTCARQRHHKENAARLVDHRRSDDSHLSVDIEAFEVGAVHIRRRSEIDVPDRRRSLAVIRVECVHAVIHRGHINDVTCPTAHLDACRNQWLRIKLIVQHTLEQHPEVRLADVLRRQDRLMEISACPRIIVVLRQHIHLRIGARRGDQAEASGTYYQTIRAGSSHSQFSSRAKPPAVLSRKGSGKQLQGVCLNSSSFESASNNLIVYSSLVSDG